MAATWAGRECADESGEEYLWALGDCTQSSSYNAILTSDSFRNIYG